LKLRLAYDYKQKYYPLNAYYTGKEWDDIIDKKSKGNNKRLKLYYDAVEKNALEVIRNLHPFSIALFERKFFKRTDKNANLITGMEDYVRLLFTEKRTGTSAAHTTTLSSVKKYLKETKQAKPIYETITVK